MYLQYTKEVNNFLSKWKTTPVIVFDTETTGLSSTTDRVIEISAMKFNGVELIDKLTLYINPGYMITPKIEELTGITNEFLSDKPREKELFPQIESFFKNSFVVAHNYDFDGRFMKAMYARNGRVWNPVGYICTLKMSKDLFDGSHKLIDMAKRLEIDIDEDSFHDASYDTYITSKVFFSLVKIYIEKIKEERDRLDTVELVKPKINSVRFWQGYSHTLSRIYIQTNVGTIWFSVYDKKWSSKEKGILDGIDMDYTRKEIFLLTNCHDEKELAKFRGSIGAR